MKQALCPNAVRHLAEEQNQRKATEQTQWPSRLPFLSHRAGQDSAVLPATPASPSLACLLLGCLLSFLPSSRGTVWTRSLTSNTSWWSFNPPTSIAAS